MFSKLNRARQLGAYDQWQRRTDKPMLVLSLAFLLVILMPVFFTNLPIPVRELLATAEVVLWAGFVVDYFVRLLLAPSRWHFFWTHIPELIVIAVPMLRPLRSLQALRLLRLGGLATAANRFARRSLANRAVLLVSAVTLILVLTGAGVVLILERGNPEATINSYPEALWWAMSTVTTVGYGDTYPVTTGGRVVAILLMIAGIALVGVITAAVASWFVRSVVKSAEPDSEAGEEVSVQDLILHRLDLLDARVANVDAEIQLVLDALRAIPRQPP